MFITFEGIDASGKTTQLKLLEEKLKKKGVDVISTRQPGGTRIGQLIREILLDPENTEMVPITEVLLYMADRIQHIQQVILPALENKQIVLCDRYHDATLAYQGGGRELDLSWMKMLQDSYVLAPDLTLWFDISLEESQKRLQQRNLLNDEENCRLENENSAFFSRIRQCYQNLSLENSSRFVQLSANGTVQSIEKEVTNIIEAKIGL